MLHQDREAIKEQWMEGGFREKPLEESHAQGRMDCAKQLIELDYDGLVTGLEA